ncbi:MAG: Rieske 2Fe-2S domain-containing protein [Candidatus Rokuibacteriota bacterium]
MMGQYDRHVFVCTSGETCPTQGDTEQYVKILRDGARQAGKQIEVRVNKAGCFSQCGHGPMIVVYPENVWYAGVQESDLAEILSSHIVGGHPVERLVYAPDVRGANKIGTDAHKSAPASAPSIEAPGAPEAAWKRVCPTGTVPANGLKEFAVDGTNVLIANTESGFVAFQALCPHEAVPLEQGVQDGSVLTCLEHLWQFDLRTGAPMADAEVGLTRYPLKEEGGDLYIELKG